MSKEPAFEGTGVSGETPAPRRPWESPVVIVAKTRNTEAHVTRFTDGYSVTHHIHYGS